MTAAQRRTVTVKIGGDAHRVELTAEVREPEELVKIATEAYHHTSPAPRTGMGFGSQIERGPVNEPTAGSPWHLPTTARGGEHHD